MKRHDVSSLGCLQSLILHWLHTPGLDNLNKIDSHGPTDARSLLSCSQGTIDILFRAHLDITMLTNTTMRERGPCNQSRCFSTISGFSRRKMNLACPTAVLKRPPTDVDTLSLPGCQKLAARSCRRSVDLLIVTILTDRYFGCYIELNTHE